MKTAEQNFQLLQEIEAGREFLLMACEQNPELLKRAEPRIRELFEYELGENVAQRGAHVQSLLTPVEQVDTESKPFSLRGKGGDGGNLQSGIARSVKVQP